MYNVVAGRPCAPLPSQAEQTLTASLSYQVSNFHTTSAIGAAVFSGRSIVLSDMLQYTEYQSLFDQYKVEQVEAWITPNGAQAEVSGNVVTCVDLDDVNSSSVAQVEAHQGSLPGPSSPGRYHCWRPRVAIAAYNGAFAGYANPPAQWLDCASAGIQHYGLKMASGGLASAVVYDLTVRALIKFRNPGI